MLLINGSQIRGARGLLNWSQDDLAKNSNVSPKTVRLIESDISARTSNIRKIQQTLVEHGIEFSHNYGVRLRSGDFFDFTGPDSCEFFFDHMSKVLKERGGDVICTVPELEMLTKNSGSDGRNNLSRLEQIQKIASVKCLIDDSIIPTFAPPAFEIRMLADEPTIVPISIFAFGNQMVGGFLDDNRMNFTFVVFNKASFMHKCQDYFMPRWNIAKTFAVEKKIKKSRA